MTIGVPAPAATVVGRGVVVVASVVAVVVIAVVVIAGVVIAGVVIVGRGQGRAEAETDHASGEAVTSAKAAVVTAEAIVSESGSADAVAAEAVAPKCAGVERAGVDRAGMGQTAMHVLSLDLTGRHAHQTERRRRGGQEFTHVFFSIGVEPWLRNVCRPKRLRPARPVAAANRRAHAGHGLGGKKGRR